MCVTKNVMVQQMLGWFSATKFWIADILNFVSTSNFISIHSPFVYKLSMICDVPKVHFGEILDNT